MKESEDALTVIRCHHCGGQSDRGNCTRCQNTGNLFWVGGHGHPYTPNGEKSARRLSSLIKAGMA